jgi:hypothetical protein
VEGSGSCGQARTRQERAGEMLAIMVVRQLPPSESLSRRVSLESRKGTYAPLPVLFRSTSALMQLPSASRLRRPETKGRNESDRKCRI